MSLRYQVTKAKDTETGIPLNFRTQPIVEERKKQRLWFFTKWRPMKLATNLWHLISNGLEAYDREINLRVEENIISNEFAVKLYLEHEVKRRNKVVKKELIIALRGEIYFVKFIINPEEDDVEPQVVFGRSFLRLTKAIADFGNDSITIYPELDRFLEDEREVLAISIYVRYSLLKEERPVIETMAYSDKYKKILDEICLDKMKLDRMNKEGEESIIKIKGGALIKMILDHL
nr:hypothetical protein [Tanacetum cinerariifolium]